MGSITKPSTSPLAPEQLSNALGTAVCAISGDNCQPWKFVWDGARLDILRDRTRDKFAYDAESESLLISFGALLENLSLALSHAGYALQLELLPDGPRAERIAAARVAPQGTGEDPLYAFAEARCVNRRMYRRQRVAREDADRILEAAGERRSIETYWLEERRQLWRLACLVSKADRMIWEHPGLFGDLRKWLRTGAGAEAADDGMPLRVLGLNPLERLMMTHLRSFRAVSCMNRLGFSRIAALKSVRWMINSGAAVIFTLRRTAPEDYIAAGRYLQRFWIKANACGVSVQPMSAWVFLLNHLAVNRAVDFSPAQQFKIGALQQRFEEILPQAAGQRPFMLLRLGYAPTPPFRTKRRAIEEVLEIQSCI